MPCDVDDSKYNCTFDMGSVHDVLVGVVEIHKQDTRQRFNIGLTLPSRELHRVILVERRVMVHEAAELMQLEGDDGVNDVSHPTEDTKDSLAVDIDVEYIWHIREILHSCAFHV